MKGGGRAKSGAGWLNNYIVDPPPRDPPGPHHHHHHKPIAYPLGWVGGDHHQQAATARHIDAKLGPKGSGR